MFAASCICLLAAAVSAAANPDGFQDGGAKSRRIPGLFPRPFVGRSNPSATWLVDLSDLGENDGKPKRGEISGLFAYPRVGRSGPDSLIQTADLPQVPHGLPGGRYHMAAKRDGDSSTGLWFGPRLGRSSKRNDPGHESPWAVIAVRDSPSAFTPRLGRESNEDFSEDYDSNKHLHAERV
ncbi:uncharacterized protein LOC128984447 [Macrosteles quadrilineatus]|uniref:uncharacterized protein LOC128984447 n=1 Tax=Macrosteles quadrilineatus TaxID=74068 RepID=UPI0023E23133|nr:uncharacterized protein LOC128984447 [Macrosteles quadrilineatus]